MVHDRALAWRGSGDALVTRRTLAVVGCAPPHHRTRGRAGRGACGATRPLRSHTRERAPRGRLTLFRQASRAHHLAPDLRCVRRRGGPHRDCCLDAPRAVRAWAGALTRCERVVARAARVLRGDGELLLGARVQRWSAVQGAASGDPERSAGRRVRACARARARRRAAPSVRRVVCALHDARSARTLRRRA